MLKRKQRRAEVSLEDVAEDHFAGDSSVGGELLLEEVAGLAGRTDRRILQLIKEGYSSREIAGKLHISKDAVRKRWERLKKKLRRGM